MVEGLDSCTVIQLYIRENSSITRTFSKSVPCLRNIWETFPHLRNLSMFQKLFHNQETFLCLTRFSMSEILFHAWGTFQPLEDFFHVWEVCFLVLLLLLFFASKCSRLKYVTVKHYPILQGSTENLTCPWAVGMILVTLHMYTHDQIFTTHLKFSWCALITYHIQ